MTSDSTASAALEHMSTRLQCVEPEQQGHLINWGYALCDVSLRARVELPVPMATRWPVPEWVL
jgi:NTE family protein